VKRTHLGEVAERIDYGVTASAKLEPIGPKFLRITDIQDGTVDWTKVPYCQAEQRKLKTSALRVGDIVFARTGATTGKSFLIKNCPEHAVFASYLIRVRPGKQIDPSFLAQFFQSPDYWQQISLKAAGAAQPGVNASKLEELTIPLPVMSEQRRIAGILDQADALRAKRRAVLAQLDEIARAIFVEMFGANNTLPSTMLSKALDFPLRNGVSPATDGQIEGEVLTLSAITGRVFDGSMKKQCKFGSKVPAEKRVKSADLLICRGNGNPSLVGRGFFPLSDAPSVVFPDTMIAARINPEIFDLSFLQEVWNGPAIREQIEQRVRTTNGTFKINQQGLEAVELPLPPMPMQKRFAQRIANVSKTRRDANFQLVGLNALFASLQHRAFAGEL